MRTPLFPGTLSAPSTAADLLGWPAADLVLHHGSARLFRDACTNEMDFSDRFSQWTEWLDQMLARRFATSVILVGGFAALIALVA